MRRAVGWLCVAAPFVAAAIAGLGPRHDYRILWMAIASTLVVWVIVVATAAKRGRGFAAMAAFVTASAAGAGIAVLAGAFSPFGVIAVAIVVAAFATAGAVLTADQIKRLPE